MLSLILFGVNGCGESIRIIHEAPDTAVVLYRAMEHNRMGSQRISAINAMEHICPDGYQIIQEGQTEGRKRVVEGVGGKEIITEPWWGIRFRCTTAGEGP